MIDEKCTIITRIAENFFRFGSFEIFKSSQYKGDRAGPSAGNEELKRKLFDHILQYYPSLKHQTNNDKDDISVSALLFKEITDRTAMLVAKWMGVGFVHGVLNTDNMSIMGLTIDYGPFGFMEHYDPDFVPNGSDNSGRYSYRQQPTICKWNLERLAEAFHPILSTKEAEEILQSYNDIYLKFYNEIMIRKFGLIQDSQIIKREDLFIIEDFFNVLKETGGDFTDSFVALTEFCKELRDLFTNFTSIDKSYISIGLDDLVAKLVSRSASPPSIVSILERKLKIHKLSMRPNDIEQLWSLLESDPAQVSQMFMGADINRIREEIEGEKKKLDFIVTIINDLEKYKVMSSEEKRTSDKEKWSQWCKKYVQRLSLDENETAKTVEILNTRVEMMSKENPTFILRNWIAQDAISKAEVNEDFTYINTILKLSKDPFNPNYSSFKRNEEFVINDPKETKYLSKPPEWADSLICTCSS